jgi:hypothetical protein
MIVKSGLRGVLPRSHYFIGCIGELHFIHIHQHIVSVTHCAAAHGMILLLLELLVVLEFSTLSEPALH